MTPYFCTIQKLNLAPVYGPWYLSDIRPNSNLHRRLFLGSSEILNNVCKPHVYGEDKKCSVVIPPSLSSGRQVLLCQRTHRNELMNVNNVTDKYFVC